MAVCCAAYYVLTWSVGRYEQYTRYILWLGGPLVALLTVIAYWRKPVGVPQEVWLFAGFVMWSLIGALVAVDQSVFLLALKTLAANGVLFACAAVICRSTGNARWLYLALCIVGIHTTLASMAGIDIVATTAAEGGERVENVGSSRNANILAWINVLGLIGALGLFGEFRSLLGRSLVVGAAMIQGLGVLLSASRGALLTVTEALVLFPILCYGTQVRKRLPALIAGALVIVGVALGVKYALQYSYVGTRMRQNLESGAEEARSVLIKEGFRVFLKHPVFGVGLNQTGEHMIIPMSTHCEYTELLSTTGLVGFALYYGIYSTCHRRTRRRLRTVRDERLRFRMNFCRLVLVLFVLAGAYQISYFVFGLVLLLGATVGISSSGGSILPVAADSRGRLGFPDALQVSARCRPGIQLAQSYRRIRVRQLPLRTGG